MTQIASNVHSPNREVPAKHGKPLLSVGLPVYNAATYIRLAIESILSQTLTDFELIISDNASTDETPDLCQTYARKDPRIKYFRNEINLGATKNFNRVFELASGKYFQWAAHDDIYSPDLLRACVDVLENDPTIVLCHATPVIINERGEELKDYMRNRGYFKLENTGSVNPHKRFADLVSRRHPCFQIFGVIRADVLRKTPGLGGYIGTDRNLLAEISLLGRFHEVPEVIYFRRHSEQYCALNDVGAQAEWYDPESRNQCIAPLSKNLAEYIRSIGRTPLKWRESLLCYLTICEWSIRRRKKLMQEFLARRTKISKALS
jgi:glycosyltransferase involved in cell wall biosynthesis